MTYEHYIPATYLAQFSAEINMLDRRKSYIWVGDKKTKEIFRSKVENIGGEKNFYSADDEPGFSIDSIWNYESRLYSSLEDLIHCRVDAITWCKVLIPFVTCMFVRGNDFKYRFTNRITSLLGFQERIPINAARCIEIQRLLTPVLASNWIVLTIQGDTNLLTNDTGFFPFQNRIIGQLGYAIPIDKRHVLVLTPRKKGVVLHQRDDKWYPIISYYELPNNNLQLNKIISNYANRNIFSDSEDLIKENLNSIPQYLPSLEPHNIFRFSHKESIAYELTWNRLVSFLESGQHKNNSNVFDLDVDAIVKYWKFPIYFPVNLTEFPTVLNRNKKEITIDCYDPEQYFTYSSFETLFRMKEYKRLLGNFLKEITKIKDKELRLKAFLLRQSALVEINRPIQSLLELSLFWHNTKMFNFQKGLCFSNIKLEKIAIKYFQESCMFDNNNDNSLQNIGTSLLRLGKIDEAFTIFSTLLNSEDEIIRALSNYQVGKIFQYKGNPEAALSQYKKIDTSKLPKIIILDLLVSKNQCFTILKQYDQIPKNCYQVLQIDPKNYDAYLAKIEYFRHSNNDKEYLQTIIKTLSLQISKKKKAKLHSLLSTYYLYSTMEIDKAKKEIITSLEYDPFNYIYHCQYGDILQLNEKKISSFSEYLFSLLLFHKDGRVFNSLGKLFKILGMDNLAIYSFNHAVKILMNDPEVIRPYRNLVKCYLEKGKYKQSEELITKINQIDPETIMSKISNILYMYYSGDFKNALLLLNKLLPQFPENPELVLLKIIILSKYHQNEEFQELLESIRKNENIVYLKNKYKHELSQLDISL